MHPPISTYPYEFPVRTPTKYFHNVSPLYSIDLPASSRYLPRASAICFHGRVSTHFRVRPRRSTHLQSICIRFSQASTTGFYEPPPKPIDLHEFRTRYFHPLPLTSIDSIFTSFHPLCTSPSDSTRAFMVNLHGLPRTSTSVP